MIRFAWRQFRTQCLVSACSVLVVAVVLALTWPQVSHLADSLPRSRPAGFAAGVSSALDTLVIIVPGLIGVFWGAPLVSRELETNCILMAWTQSVTRRRWLAVKLGVVGLTSLAVSGLFSLMGTLWSSPIDQVNMDQFSPFVFSARGIAPLGYAAFAFVLGVAAGVMIGRAQPAMAATLAAFAGIRVAVTYWVRPYLDTPEHQAFDLNSSDVEVALYTPEQAVKAFVSMPNALVRSIDIVNDAGHSLTPQAIQQAFPNAQSHDPGWYEAGVEKLASAYHVVVTYQPADRFWTFQAVETAFFVILALALVALCFWWVERRLP